MFVNDKRPRARAARRRSPAPTTGSCSPVSVGEDATIGSGALILGGVTIGRGAMIGAGAVVTADVADGRDRRGGSGPAG